MRDQGVVGEVAFAGLDRESVGDECCPEEIGPGSTDPPIPSKLAWKKNSMSYHIMKIVIVLKYSSLTQVLKAHKNVCGLVGLYAPPPLG